MKRLVFILLPVILSAQSGWVKLIGGPRWDEGYDVVETDEGGYVITGIVDNNWASTSNDTGDLCVVKTNANGEIIWKHTYGGKSLDIGYSVKSSADGGYIITGCKRLVVGDWSRDFDLWLLKTTSYGDTLWTRTFGSPDIQDIGRCVNRTSDGGYIIAGCCRGGEVWLLKTDSLGNTEWTKKYGAYGDFSGSLLAAYLSRDVRQTKEGGYIVAGYKGHEAWLLRTDSLGDTIWTRTFGGDGAGGGHSVVETSDGYYVITGYIETPSPEYSFGAFLAKVDWRGNTVWARTYPGFGIGRSVLEDKNGGYVVLSSELIGDVALLRTDCNGDTIWTQTYNCEGYCSSVRQTNEGGYIIVGLAYLEGAGETDILLIKTDSLGRTPLCIKPTRGPKLNRLDNPSFKPTARFTNFGTEDSPYDLVAYCVIIGLENHNSDYHDSVFVGRLGGWESVSIKFRKWTADIVGNYKVYFYITNPEGAEFDTDTMTRTFYWDPLQIEEPVIHQQGFEVLVGLGPQVVFRFNGTSPALTLQIFDASGHKVDEVYSNLKSGTIEWGEGFNSGVYFVRVEDGSSSSVQKVVLIR